MGIEFERREVEEAVFLRVLGEAVALLDEAEVPYAVMGGIASSAFGRQRGTLDEEESALEPVQLFEEAEYRYHVDLADSTADVRLEPEEVFQPDNQTGRSGRIKTGAFVGLLPIAAYVSEKLIGRAYVEVRSRKFDYLSHFRWMLNDLVEYSSAIVQDRFAPTQSRVRPMEGIDAQTAYERFALLQAVLTESGLEAALAYVIAHPHQGWVEEVEYRSPSRGLQARSGVRSEIVRPGPRVPSPHLGPWVRSVPRTMRIGRPESTIDTIPNQFVKFVLLHWLASVGQFRTIVGRLPEGAARRRGLREIQQVTNRLDAWLAEPLLRGVSTLAIFPIGNQVLQKREGYRDILRAYVQVEGATELAWTGGDDVFGIGQRNVATLYEFWSFIELAKIIRSLCDELDEASLIQLVRGTLTIDLVRGTESHVDGTATRRGRRFSVRLHFNRRFSFSATGSWTKPMQPDCSLQLTAGGGGSAFESIWVHFDAKYRADQLLELLGSDESDSEELDPDAPIGAVAKRADLLKMHAYRDAIRRSVGSYILYPGLPQTKADCSNSHWIMKLSSAAVFCFTMR